MAATTLKSQAFGNTLVTKMAVLRQDNTTDAYVSNQVILTGWGFIVGDNNTIISETVTFGVTFSTPPVVVITGLDYTANATTTDTIDDWVNTATTGDLGVCNVTNISTTTFKVWLSRRDAAAINSGYKWGYSWIAIGTLT